MTTTRFHVPAMDCATEKEVIANHLERMPDVKGLDFDILERVVSVTHTPGTEDAIEAALGAIQMKPKRLVAGAPRAALVQTSPWTREVWLLIASGLAAAAAEIIAWTTDREDSVVVIALSVAAMLLGGPTTFKKGLVALRTLTLNINLLMLIAVTGAMIIGQWPEAAMVTFLFAVAELIESRSLDRARQPRRALARGRGQRGHAGHARAGPAWRACATRWPPRSGHDVDRPGPDHR